MRGRPDTGDSAMLCPSIRAAKGAIVTDLQQDAPSAPPAGWYPDPVRPGATRYWSGTGWTDQVSAPVAEPALAPVGPQGFLFDVAPVVEAPPATFATAPLPPTERHASQSEWHQTRAKPIQRPTAPPVSTSMRSSSSAAARQSDPYDRNWIAGVAIALAVLSIPGLAARVLWDLPALTQSIFAGAPIGISLLALARGARRGSGLVLSIIAVVLSAATLIAGWLVDPALVEAAVDAIAGLLPA
jgi:hypothetical protein